jgi:succinate dehydrogenase / fumarate reductase cytochrome b subunit
MAKGSVIWRYFRVSSPVKPAADEQAIPTAALPSKARAPYPPSWVLKVCLAVTGTIFVAFVIFHLFGNLKVFLGKEALNHYAFWLQKDFMAPLIPEGWFVWIFRGVLGLCLVLHVYAAVAIRMRARKARGTFRRKGLKGMENFQARHMLATGLFLLFFIVFHLLDLTAGVKPIASDKFEHLNAYDNLVASFDRPVVAIFYILAMGVLFLHLAHGLWSVVNDLGATGKRFRAFVFAISGGLALLIMLGNIVIPFAVMFGFVS